VLLRDQNDRLEMLREERRMLVEELERESRERRQLQISAQNHLNLESRLPDATEDDLSLVS
jgi:hypothetical protein